MKVETTPGRMILSDALPQNENISFDIINKILTKKEVSNIIDAVYRFCGQKETVYLQITLCKLVLSMLLLLVFLLVRMI